MIAVHKFCKAEGGKGGSDLALSYCLLIKVAKNFDRKYCMGKAGHNGPFWVYTIYGQPHTHRIYKNITLIHTNSADFRTSI